MNGIRSIGTVEAYDARGRHIGEFDPINGRQLKEADPSRRVEP
jgi:filamentous hemagglutinin